MAEFPLLLDVPLDENAGSLTASSRGTSVPYGGTLHVKGSYAQLIASTVRDAKGVWIEIESNENAQARGLIDVAIGGAGSEQVIFPNLFSVPVARARTIYPIPIQIPAGSRIAARGQYSATFSPANITAHLLPAGMGMGGGYGFLEASGVDTLDTSGTAVDPGVTANTKGSWVELVAATTRTYRQVTLALLKTAALSSTLGWLVDIGVGAAGSEVVVVPDLMAGAYQFGNYITPAMATRPVNIPAGSRVAVRAQSTSTNATDRVFDAILYGVG